eukprot:8168207-Pyramimonas_sp.AAC.1
MTNGPDIGGALYLLSRAAQARGINGGRTSMSDIYADRSRRTAMRGLAHGTQADERTGRSRKSCDPDTYPSGLCSDLEVNEARWDQDEKREVHALGQGRLRGRHVDLAGSPSSSVEFARLQGHPGLRR